MQVSLSHQEYLQGWETRTRCVLVFSTQSTVQTLDEETDTASRSVLCSFDKCSFWMIKPQRILDVQKHNCRTEASVISQQVGGSVGGMCRLQSEN